MRSCPLPICDWNHKRQHRLWLEDLCLYAARVVHGDESEMRVGIGSLVQCKQEVPDYGNSVLSRSRPGRLASFDRVSLSD